MKSHHWSPVHILVMSVAWKYSTRYLQIFPRLHGELKDLIEVLSSMSMAAWYVSCVVMSCKFSVRSAVLRGIFILVIFAASILCCKMATIMDFSMICTWTSLWVVVVSAVTMNVSFNVSEDKRLVASSWDKPHSYIPPMQSSRLISVWSDTAIISESKTNAERSKPLWNFKVSLLRYQTIRVR